MFVSSGKKCREFPANTKSNECKSRTARILREILCLIDENDTYPILRVPDLTSTHVSFPVQCSGTLSGGLRRIGVLVAKISKIKKIKKDLISIDGFQIFDLLSVDNAF